MLDEREINESPKFEVGAAGIIPCCANLHLESYSGVEILGIWYFLEVKTPENDNFE